MEEKPSAATPEVNRLYWQTAASVAEISNNLGISRRALYELIEPLPTGVECSSCGAELYFSNRSAKSAGIARCLVCGSENELTSVEPIAEVAAVPQLRPGAKPVRKPSTNGLRERAAMVAGFALAGLVVGAVATMLLRKRR